MEIYTSALPVSGKAKIGRVRGGGGVGDGITESNKSRATAIILKALGSDKSSVKFESLICLPPF